MTKMTLEEKKEYPLHNCPLCGRPAGYGPKEGEVLHMTCLLRVTKHLRKEKE